jgi:hypothetical protein
MYGKSMEGVRSYIVEKYTDEATLKLAMDRWSAIHRSISRGRPYPPEYVLNYFMGGGIKRMLVPKYPMKNKTTA